MMRRTTLLFAALLCSLASMATITGPSSICTSSPASFIDSGAATGGTWSSSNIAIAVISSSFGTSATVSGVASGIVTISYVVGSTVDTKVVTVNAGPAAIVGGGVTICAGSTLALSDPTPGGVWSVSGSSSIGSTTGILTAGAYSGVDTVYYTVGSCSATTPVTIVLPDSLTGPSLVCVGSTISLSAMASGGTWSSSNSAIATVSGGVVTGVLGGTATIFHTTTGSCGTYVASHVVTVTTTGSAGTITGPSSIGVGGVGYLTDSVAGGVWSSSNPSVATISPGGAVTGIAPGTTTISYAVAPCGGTTVYATYVITVSVMNGISGHVRYSGSGMVKVWLIKYNASTMMLTAVDSTTAYATDSMYYQFLGLATDSFRVKATIDSAAFLGYVPTYHNSSFYWSAATVIHHTSGMWDANKDINLITGTSTSGSGFIGGSVLTGANKGTADGAPAVGIDVYLVNSTSSAVMGHTKTDASGNYSFSSVPFGTYHVFPEALSYVTTPYTGIVLSSSASSMSAARFTQRTISKKFTPILAGVNDLNSANTSIVAFPNPTNGKLNISWDAATTEAATVVITDVTGREVLAKDFSMTKGNGTQVVDLSSFASGMYFVSVRSANTMYVSKMEVRH